MLSDGVAAIFGPNSMQSVGIVASISNEFAIPHMIGHWAPEPEEYKRPFRQFTRNFFPSSNHFSRALADLIDDYDWKVFTIVYEDEFSLQRLHDVLQIHEPEDSPVNFIQFL